MRGDHKTVEPQWFALLWLFLYFVLLCSNMNLNRQNNRNPEVAYEKEWV